MIFRKHWYCNIKYIICVHKACVETILGVTIVGTPGKHVGFYVTFFQLMCDFLLQMHINIESRLMNLVKPR